MKFWAIKFIKFDHNNFKVKRKYCFNRVDSRPLTPKVYIRSLISRIFASYHSVLYPYFIAIDRVTLFIQVVLKAGNFPQGQCCKHQSFWSDNFQNSQPLWIFVFHNFKKVYLRCRYRLKYRKSLLNLNFHHQILRTTKFAYAHCFLHVEI